MEVGDPEPLPPLYGKADVQAVTPHFAEVPYFRLQPKWIELSAEVRFKFYDAGHILGSAVTLLEVQEAGTTKRLAYTGDLGQFPVPILMHPEQIIEPVDVLLIESTYGDRVHRANAEALDMLAKIIHSAATHGRTIVMPAFALGRVQEIIYMLHQVYDRPETPRIPIYVDSPLAERLIPIFEKHVEDYNTDVKKDFGAKREMPFEFPELTYLRTPEDSKSLNDKTGPMIILGSSGMMEGGRILHHLVRRIEDHSAMIVITGYQADGTLGRKIQNRVSPVRVLGKMYQVNAEVITIDEFSAHADRAGLLAYVKSVPGLQRVCLVHGEPEAANSFKQLLNQELPQIEVIVPAPGQSITV
jgi:metallo-beta-lactamase family protein